MSKNLCRFALTLAITSLASVSTAHAEEALSSAPDKPVASPKASSEAIAVTGFQFDLGTGVHFMQGAAMKGAEDVNTYGLAVHGHAGYYVTRHVGALVGVGVTFGANDKGCLGSCSAASFQLPLVLQYAITDRRHGAFFEGGASLFNYLRIGATPAVDVRQTVDLFSPVDLALGVGYRTVGNISNTTLPIEITLRSTIGQYTSITENITAGSEKLSAYKAFDASERAFHATFVLGAGISL